ncbi:MAG TPA: phospholipase D-like domain-containing protein [Candidatus Deferrimicrobium sp.]|nr:phospholipase D-like domain-containing protein [Candidatus Deferrimicrobium sp.]
MDESYYKKKAKDLDTEIVVLRKKVKELEDKLFNKLGMNQFYIKNTDAMVLDLIHSCNRQLQIITTGIDLKLLDYIQNLALNGKRIQIITLERHRLMDQNLINAFDKLQGISGINVYTNKDVRANILIKDDDQVTISSARLILSELRESTNFCIISVEKQVIEQFQNYFNNHLPQFLRI